MPCKLFPEMLRREPSIRRTIQALGCSWAQWTSLPDSGKRRLRRRDEGAPATARMGVAAEDVELDSSSGSSSTRSPTRSGSTPPTCGADP